MTLDDILSQTRDLAVYERRSLNPEYCELVFFSRDLAHWHRVLSAALGEPRKPAGLEPTKADLEITSQTGGIRLNQTLFEKDFGERTIIAKIWPWDDAQYMTLKMAVLYS